MPTTFPLDTYPLTDKTRFSNIERMERTVLDDGSMQIAVLGDSSFVMIRCVFNPLYASASTTFEEYLRTNRSTEFDIVYEGNTYRGYIWSNVEPSSMDGDLIQVSFDFRGQVVA